MAPLRYDGRVAVVTGAGGGLGKAYALLLGSRGAKVVVNDLGGARDGQGKSANFADAVVEEIKRNGGEAVADYNSVVEGEKIIKTALDKFGRVDILINNAGILRDRSFAKISEQDWDLIHAVHMKGAFKTTQAAWETFKKQKYGRVIMTSSNAGVFGNFGQANYSAAKLGLVGLANTLAIEGSKYNILVNTIVPTAASRLTEDILPPEMFEAMKPELIAPVVAYMVHESFDETGMIVDSTLGYATKTHFVRSNGTHLRSRPEDPVTIESVKQSWSKVVDMKNAKHFNHIGEVTLNLVDKMQEFVKKSKLENGRESYWSTFDYNSKDVALYALGVGASVSDPEQLRYVYESDGSFNALPTFFILAGMSMESNLVPSAMPPGKRADFTNILHGEQYIEFVGEYPSTEGSFVTRAYVADVLDKGSSTVCIVNSEIYNGETLVYRTQQHVVVAGQGGWGGPRASEKATPVLQAPKRAPDAFVEQLTQNDQAALYRLSGDLNPLHIDPSMASASGFDRPILHGLATLGFSVRHVLLKYGGNDPANIVAVKARFVKPVLPGHTLLTEMWLEGTKVHFQTKTKENDSVVIAGAYVDLKKVAAPTKSASPSGSVQLKSDGAFAMMHEQLQKNLEKARSIGGLMLYKITEGGKIAKEWTLDLKSGSVYEGPPKSGKIDATITIADGDMVDLVSGTLSPQVGYLKGKIKISGNLMLVQKLGPFLRPSSKI